MGSRRKNLLEAFQSASQAPPGPGSPPANPIPRSGFHERPPRQILSRGIPTLPPWLLPLVALAVTFALGFVVGKGSSREAVAAPAGKPEPAALGPEGRRPATQPRPPEQAGVPDAAPASAAPASSGTPIEESPLFDAKNVYTVVVAAYSSSSEDLAWATYEHLADQDLPVFPPVQSGKVLIVLVGAAPTSAELAATESAVRALLRDGQKAYDTAYRARIDKLIPRTK